MASHGTTTSYRSGCRCGPCRRAQRLYQREWRAGHLPPGRSRVTELPAPEALPLADGAVVQAVRADLEALPVGRARATERAAALSLAQVLDDSSAVPQRAAAARQLMTVMSELRAGRAPLTGPSSTAADVSFQDFQRRRAER